MKSLALFVAVFLCAFSSLWAARYSIPRLHRGRPRGHYGMLGRPRGANSIKKTLPELWIEQRLDHFNPANTDTWKQRYFVNDAHYKTGGPAFLLMGGEGTADPSWLLADTQIMNFAKTFNAIVFSIEHRFYGKSWPTKDMSDDNLAYLTSQQSLADAAYFRNKMVKERGLQDSKWVVFGGSYSGSLAAWFKLKYPHLAVGAVASSAPLYAVVNFKDYLAVVRDSLATTGPECNSQIQEAIDRLMFLTSDPGNWDYIRKLFRLCDYFNGLNKNDLANFYQTLAGNFEGIVQYNRDAREFEGGTQNITINTLCNIMTNKGDSSSPLEKFAKVNQLLVDSNDEECVDFVYDNFINSLRETSFNSSAAEGGRQWTYQTCIEFGYFQSSDLKDQPFGPLFPVEFFVRQCKDIFGAHFDNALLSYAVGRTNTQFGGFHPVLKNVTFPNGSIDPWHALGITKSISSDVQAIYINGTAHCADMYPDSPEDLPELIEARLQIQDQIAEWVGAQDLVPRP